MGNVIVEAQKRSGEIAKNMCEEKHTTKKPNIREVTVAVKVSRSANFQSICVNMSQTATLSDDDDEREVRKQMFFNLTTDGNKWCKEALKGITKAPKQTPKKDDIGNIDVNLQID